GAAQVASVESVIAAQRTRGRLFALGELVQHTYLRQRERALIRPLAQHADSPGVGPVEAARGLRPLLQLARRHTANVREILDYVKYFLWPRPCLDSADPHGRRPEPTAQKDHHARCLAGSTGPHLRAPRPPGGRTRADARQPARRPGPALVLQVGDRPGDQPAPPRAAVAARPRPRRRQPRPGHYRTRPAQFRGA